MATGPLLGLETASAFPVQQALGQQLQAVDSVVITDAAARWTVKSADIFAPVRERHAPPAACQSAVNRPVQAIRPDRQWRCASAK